MNVKLLNNRPKGATCGVYRIVFDNGMFYIGSSSNLVSRASSWRRGLSGAICGKGVIWASIINKVAECKNATFEVILLVDRSNLLKEEAAQMALHKGDLNMINVLLHPKTAVIVRDLSGVELRRFESLSSCSETMGIFPRRIQDVCNGRRKKCCGYIFEYENKTHIRAWKRRPKKERLISILKYSTDGQFIKGYLTQDDAAKDTGITRRGVFAVLRGEQKTAGGCVFKYAN